MIQIWLFVANPSVRIELSYFMCIHAGGGHSDSTGPVEVAVAQSENEFFGGALAQISLVHGYIDVSWPNTALSRGVG